MFFPVIVTFMLMEPVVGAKDNICGFSLYTKPIAVTVSAPAIILTAPVLLGLATIAVIEVPEFIIKDFAGVLPKLTEVTLLKLAPSMLITVPPVPTNGLNCEIRSELEYINPSLLAMFKPDFIMTLPDAPLAG